MALLGGMGMTMRLWKRDERLDGSMPSKNGNSATLVFRERPVKDLQSHLAPREKSGLLHTG